MPPPRTPNLPGCREPRLRFQPSASTAPSAAPSTPACHPAGRRGEQTASGVTKGWTFGPGKHPSLGYAGAGPQPGNRGDVQTGTQASSSRCPPVPPTRCWHRKQFQSTSGQIQGRKMLRDRLRKCTSSGWPPSCTSPGAPREAAGAASPPPATPASCRPPTPSQLLGGRVLPRAPC